jgi:hypothetical protein
MTRNVRREESDRLIEALMHLEMALGRTEGEAADRVWAAHYLVQSVVNNAYPLNYHRVLAKARRHDANYQMTDVIESALGSPIRIKFLGWGPDSQKRRV